MTEIFVKPVTREDWFQCTQLEISDENAGRLYEKVGFEKTGEMINGEIIRKIRVD